MAMSEIESLAQLDGYPFEVGMRTWPAGYPFEVGMRSWPAG
jgi:hypothetical protein